MSYVIDIKTRFIPNGQRVYIIFPGEGYRFYSDMKSKSAIFLDIPGFQLPEIADKETANYADFIQRLTMSERIKAWHLHGKEPDKQPERILEKVTNYKKTQKKVQLSGLIRNFYYGLRKGDIIIVPSKKDEDDVLFGEVTDDIFSSYIEVARYSEEKIPIRKVRWIKSVKRAEIPIWLERKIPSPSPVRQIEQSYFNNIFDIMYQRYHFNENFVCKYAVTSNEFSSLDDYLFQEIMLYITALYARSHDKTLANIENKTISDLVREIQRSEIIPDLRININSPGYIVSYAKTLTPIIAAVLIALSAGEALTDAGEIIAPQIQIINSADDSQAAQECQADVQREVLEDLKAMGYERWQEICKSAQLIRGHTGLTSGMVVNK